MRYTLILVVLAILGCNQNYIKSIYPIPSRKLFKRENYYINSYGSINTAKDTIIIRKKLYRAYSNGRLKKIGKLDDGKPVAYWYFFNDSLNLEYILNYRPNSVDSFNHPFSIIQKSWRY